ncbi:MAG: fumarylacetoacetate hydrolase family protein [Acidimicrobiia bacterium]
MRLATIRLPGRTTAVRAEGDEAVELDAPDLGALLADPAWRARAEAASGARHRIDGLDLAPPVPRPDKVVCVGLNYRDHIAEFDRETPEHPTLFAKFSGALIGAHDDIELPWASEKADWEAELGVVVGAPLRNPTRAEALAGIAGYTVVNDVSVRDWQYRTSEWLQGKTWERTTPVGPWLVTADESPGPSRTIECLVDGESMQLADTADMIFDPADVVAYVATFITLLPGDLIATGTPSGVGSGRKPRRFLVEGEVVTTRIEGVGELRNRCRRTPPTR